MTENNRYDWSNGPADLQDHSIAKHELLSAYLFEYLITLNKRVGKEEFRLTIVDGFSGGGLYQNNGRIVQGSPLIALETVQKASNYINSKREKHVLMAVDYWFIDVSKSACSFLADTLKEKEHANANQIKIVNGAFVDQIGPVVDSIKRKSPESGRSIFVLDQYGYKDVPLAILSQIFQKLPKAEIILTFHFDSLSRYASDANLLAIERNLGMDSLLGGMSIKDVKRERPKQWKAFLQAALYDKITKGSGALFHTPFFIKSDGGGGDFWLLHLSMHARARDVMTGVHWKNANRFVHLGGPGADMFHAGYVTTADERYSSQIGFQFDEDARSQSVSELMKQIPELVLKQPNISVADLYVQVCNSMPATFDIFKDAIALLSAHRELNVLKNNGHERRRTTRKPKIGGFGFRAVKIKDDDLLTCNSQTIFLLNNDRSRVFAKNR